MPNYIYLFEVIIEDHQMVIERVRDMDVDSKEHDIKFTEKIHSQFMLAGPNMKISVQLLKKELF